MANTGGIAAPGTVRPTAAAKALGAPKGPAKPAAGVNKAKIALPKAAAKAKAPTQKPAKAAKAPSAKVFANLSAGKPAGMAFNPAQKFYNEAQLAHLSTKLAQQEAKVELEPYQNERKASLGTEETVAKRFGEYGQQANKILEGLSGEAQASAKTFENQVAENATKTAGEIDSTGQQAQTNNAGQLPQAVQEQIGAEGRLTANLGGAAGVGAARQSYSQEGLMQALRGAAAQRIVEGEKGIATKYEQERGKIGEKESSVLSKVVAKAESKAEKMGQEQETDVLARGKLEATGEYQKGEVKTKTEANKVKEQTNEVNLKTKEASTSEKAKAEAEKIRVAERKNTITAELGKEKNQIDQKYYTEKNDAAIKTAEAKLKTAAKGGLTTSEQNKMAGEFGSAYQTIEYMRSIGLSPSAIRQALVAGSFKANQGGKATSIKVAKVVNPVLVNAAMEVWNYHKVSATTANQLKGQGFTTTPQELVGL